jgi:hypothetical protein
MLCGLGHSGFRERPGRFEVIGRRRLIPERPAGPEWRPLTPPGRNM